MLYIEGFRFVKATGDAKNWCLISKPIQLLLAKYLVQFCRKVNFSGHFVHWACDGHLCVSVSYLTGENWLFIPRWLPKRSPRSLLTRGKCTYYSKLIADHSGNHWSFGQAFNKILHHCPKMHVPDHSSIVALANTFRSIFIKEISVVHSSFPTDSQSCVLNPPDTRKILQNLTCATANEVRRLVLLAPCKSSDLDPISTSLVTDCIDIRITLIPSIVNLLLTAGSFPSHCISTLVSPRLKKPNLKKERMKHNQPVSNLSFLSKVFEKFVVKQLNSHINSSYTSDHYQSA